MNEFVEKLSSSDPSSAFPVVLTWGWISNLEPDFNHHAYCYREDDNRLHCGCNNLYDGNPYLSNGCQGKNYVLLGVYTVMRQSQIINSMYHVLFCRSKTGPAECEKL